MALSQSKMPLITVKEETAAKKILKTIIVAN
jgi:hypothetical protein